MVSIVRRIVRRFSRYDEARYWRSRRDPNAPKAREPDRLQFDCAYIRDLLDGAGRVLEFGPGVGRTFGAYSPGTRIVCYDITANYRERLQERAEALSLDVTHEVAPSVEAVLPYRDVAFGAAVASQVLQHQRPERIERVMGELIRVAEKVIVTSSWGRTRARRHSHSFHHDYVTLCAAIGCEMHHVRLMDGTIYFVYTRIR